MNRREFLAAAAVAPLAPAGLARAALAASLGGSPYVFVTADTESHVAVLSPTTGRILRRIHTTAGPRSVEAVGYRFGVVAHTAGGAVTILDSRPLRIRHVLREFAEPRYTAAHPSGHLAFVTDSRRGEVVAVDVVRGEVLGRLRLDGPARHVTIDHKGRTLWVSLGSKAERVAVVDVARPDAPRLLRTLQPPFLAHDVGFSLDRRHVWVTSGSDGQLAIYDRRERRPLFTLPADAPPQHVTFTDDLAYVTSGDDGTLRVHRLGDGRAIRTTRVPVGSYNVQEGLGLIVTPSLERGTLCILGGAGALLHRTQVAPSSHDACLVMGR
ncbi:MAG TPA: WD40 repeat domain-containing protein [Gaiellaceae bacterium]